MRKSTGLYQISSKYQPSEGNGKGDLTWTIEIPILCDAKNKTNSRSISPEGQVVQHQQGRDHKFFNCMRIMWKKVQRLGV